MHCTVISAEQLEDVMTQLDVEVRTDYSGRGMYGDKCLAIVGDLRDLLRFAAELTQAIGVEDANDILGRVRSDSMGLSSVYYFPGAGVAE
jgi:hypothetical protein